MIDYECPDCGVAMSSPDSLVGKFGTCPICGIAAAVPAGKSNPERRYQRRWRFRSFAYVIFAVVITSAILLVWWLPGVYRNWADSPSPRLEHSTGGWNDSEISTEYTNVGHRILRRWEIMPDGVQIITRYDKDTGISIHKTIAIPGKEGETGWPGLDTSASGPVTESGKRHGEWIISAGLAGMLDMLERRDAKNKAVRPEDIKNLRQEQWYWYGEEVSEGEFHIRDRR